MCLSVCNFLGPRRIISIPLRCRATPNQLRVRMSEWDASGDLEPLPAQEFTVARIVLHATFNPVNLVDDVAILRLVTPVPLGQFPTVATACLPVTAYVGQRFVLSACARRQQKCTPSKTATFLRFASDAGVGLVDGAKMTSTACTKPYKRKWMCRSCPRISANNRWRQLG